MAHATGHPTLTPTQQRDEHLLGAARVPVRGVARGLPVALALPWQALVAKHGCPVRQKRLRLEDGELFPPRAAILK